MIQRPYLRTLAQALLLLQEAYGTTDERANAMIEAFVGDLNLQDAFFDFAASRTGQRFKTVKDALKHLHTAESSIAISTRSNPICCCGTSFRIPGASSSSTPTPMPLRVS